LTRETGVQESGSRGSFFFAVRSICAVRRGRRWDRRSRL